MALRQFSFEMWMEYFIAGLQSVYNVEESAFADPGAVILALLG
jgi:hypothetical protein